MILRVAAFTLLVRDYDEAIDWYRDCLGFVLIEDTRLDEDKRWVLMAPKRESTTRLLLARAGDARQEQQIGDQAGGRVSLFFDTDDFARDHARMLEAGVRFLEEPRHESYGTVAVFVDLYGNRCDLIEPRSEAG